MNKEEKGVVCQKRGIYVCSQGGQGGHAREGVCKDVREGDILYGSTKGGQSPRVEVEG